MMKKSILGGCLTLAVAVMSITPALAHGKHGPCGAVWKACSEANSGDKTATHACVEAIKGGGAVPETVKVSDADAKACAAAPSHGKGKTAPDSSGASSGANPS
jgi:hypothetical protein